MTFCQFILLRKRVQIVRGIQHIEARNLESVELIYALKHKCGGLTILEFKYWVIKLAVLSCAFLGNATLRTEREFKRQSEINIKESHSQVLNTFTLSFTLLRRKLSSTKSANLFNLH